MKIMADDKKTKNILSFLGLAYKDYLAARTLLRTEQLFRGVILFCTAIEKYFKVFLAAKGNMSKTHNVLKLFDTVRNFDKNLADSINKDFIVMLSNSYNMRYFDNEVFNNTSQEFNICVLKLKVLAELDYTVDLLENGWSFSDKNGAMKRQYNTDFEAKNELLYSDNYLLQGLSKEEFLLNPDYILELRNTKQMGVIEMCYRTHHSSNDGRFNIEALRKTE